MDCTDYLLAMVVPKPPPSHISSKDGEIEDEDEDLVSYLSPDSFCNAYVQKKEFATFRRPIFLTLDSLKLNL